MLSKMCIAAANYLIERTNTHNSESHILVVPMTCKRLQKLLYFSDVEYMKRNGGESMFQDDFRAWPSGPVIPSVYYKYMKYQKGHMSPLEEPGHSPLSQAMKDALEYTLQKTWELDTLDLVEISHVDGGPWRRFYNDNDPNHEQVIPKCEIYSFYSNRCVF